MPGFLGVIGTLKANGFAPEKRINLLQELKSGEGWYLERRTLPKFGLDKPFFEDNRFLILVEGVVLNRKAFESNYQQPSFAEAIIAAYKSNGETFFNEFRGSFSGLLFDKSKNIWLLYTNQIGDKQVFYSQQPNDLIFGSEPGFVIEYLKRNNLEHTLDEEAAYMLLTYGYFIENHTLAQEVKKLTAGHYLRVCNNKVEELQYHRFTNEPDVTKTPDEWIDGIDHHFRQAVKLQFDKDLEYKYKHITTLSGGLDSRMTVMVAHDMGYADQLNTTFSQSNYLDATIAQQIASDLRHSFLFKALDNGLFLNQMDEATEITYGGADYSGLVHGKSFYELIDFDKFGVIHTGQIGDAILGTFYPKPVIEPVYKIGDGAHSLVMIDRLQQYHFKYSYANLEIFKLYGRAFTGANQGLLVFQEKTESCSPFIDVDFLSFCYSIPVELRHNHKIYFDWVFKKYPKAADYVWERIKEKISPVQKPEMVSILGKQVQRDKILQWMIGAVRRRLPAIFSKKNVNPLSSSFHMNPLDYWYQTNPELKRMMDTYFNTHIDLVKNQYLKQDCHTLFEQDLLGDKLHVLSFLSALKFLTR